MIQITFITVLITALVGGGIWALNQFRDHVVAQRDAQYIAAAAKKNVVLRQANTEAERVEAVLEGVVAAALEEAKKVSGTACPASPEQAKALSKIRKAR